jgi:hypothetical protein
MRHITRVIAVCLLLLATAWAIALPGSGSAQDEASMADHPLVGTWILTDDDAPDDPPFLAIFSSDGTYQQIDYDGSAGFGVWEATGPTTANMSFMAQEQNDDGSFGGAVTIRASIEVAADGMSLTADFTLQFVSGDFDSGELGPGSVTGTKMMVEPMGTPVASFDEFDEEGTPEASPAG